MYFGEAPILFPLIMKDVERVGVLRGPQGTLYGSGSPGGTIHFIVYEASFDGFSVNANARLSTMYASDELGYGGDIVINAPLIDDSLALRVVANWDEVGGDNIYMLLKVGAMTGDDLVPICAQQRGESVKEFMKTRNVPLRQ